MASGSQNMTTYLAKQVIGSNIAANPEGALLQSGINRADNSATGNTWIFLNTVNSATNPWGILHSQTDNKIKIIGDGTDDFWVDMDTGDTYILGKVGIGYDPETSGNTYKLYVNGAIRIDSTLHIFPNSENYTEGIRIHPYSSWSDITLCGNDNTGDSGTSANSWFIGNNNGNFYITRYGSTSSGADAQRSEFSSVNNQWRLRSYVQAHKAGIYRSGLHIYGPTYGNTATDMVSETAGLFSWNDGGPQITFDTNETPGGGQAGALIFTDHDTAGTGASWHFVSNQTDWNVTSKRFHARTSITIRDAAAPTATANSTNTTFIGAAYMELMGSTPYIDFHYNNDTSDYTYRLIANHTDGVTLTSKSGVNCWLYVGNGTDTAGIYWSTFGGGVYMNDSKWLRTYGYKPFIIDINENNAWGIGGHRLALGLSGASHVSLMLKGGNVMYGFAVNNNGSWYLGKRTTQSFESRTDDAYVYYGHATLFAPYTTNSVDLGDDTHRWKTVQSYSHITAAQGNIWAGTDADTTAERDVGVRSGAGTMYMWSAASATGNRGIWLAAHGTGSAKSVFVVDTNNNVTFYGTFTGNASSATSASKINIAGGTGATYYKLIGVPSYASGDQSVYVSSPAEVNNSTLRCSHISATAGYLTSTANSNTVTIGSQNSGFCHIYNTASIPFIFNNTVCTTAGDLGNASYPFGNLILKAGGRVSGNGGALYLGNSNNANWVLIADCCAQAGSAYWKIYSGSGEATFKKVYNAVWNDYAECREVETEEPGYCVTETKSGKMIKTTKRLQAGCKIISDTFGTCMGETETAKTPIAVAGRVLVYPYRAREEYTLGAAVCSAPDGTVDIMSRDEIMMYPERIVGTVSEIPTYDIWNGGISKDPDPISVNGRIWIYVK